MSRAPRSVPSHARRKKVFKLTKGMRGRRKNNITTANAAADKSLQHNYIGRKEKKRNFRALWIQRINAAVREHGLTYGRFIDGLVKAEIAVDRKVLSDIAITEPAAFAALVAQSKKALGYLGEIEKTTAARVA
jgi:large subunit ribosomal protein L20